MARLTERALSDYWYENYLNRDTGLCGLCGNTGKIDTTATAISAAGVKAGGKHFCICPNGLALRAALRSDSGGET